jgi:hypothetical protein
VTALECRAALHRAGCDRWSIETVRIDPQRPGEDIEQGYAEQASGEVVRAVLELAR